jgi:hypothetical protein
MQQPVITLFKTEFLDYPQLCKELDILPDEVTESEFSYAYRPPFRKLSRVLKMLKQNSLIHGIHFENRKPSDLRPAHKFQSQFIHI